MLLAQLLICLEGYRTAHDMGQVLQNLSMAGAHPCSPVSIWCAASLGRNIVQQLHSWAESVGPKERHQLCICVERLGLWVVGLQAKPAGIQPEFSKLARLRCTHRNLRLIHTRWPVIGSLRESTMTNDQVAWSSIRQALNHSALLKPPGMTCP